MAKKRVVCSMEAVTKRVKKMEELRKEWEAMISDAHVRLQRGNGKTGRECWTVSLIPILDCLNCAKCMIDCYDIQHVCFQPNVQNDRARNSAIHKLDKPRFWREVDEEIKRNHVEELRLNVGGDLDNEDFAYVAELGKANPQTDMLFFTKNYDGCNAYIDEHIDEYSDNFGFPSNVHPVYSRWPGMEMKNPYGVPESHVLWEDGSTTAPEFGAYYCGGNCSECHFKREGCWVLKRGEHVIFVAH